MQNFHRSIEKQTRNSFLLVIFNTYPCFTLDAKICSCGKVINIASDTVCAMGTRVKTTLVFSVLYIFDVTVEETVEQLRFWESLIDEKSVRTEKSV